MLATGLLAQATVKRAGGKATTKVSPSRPAPPWKRANPKPKVGRTKLSARAKQAARARAAKAGRRYPNLVDNRWAARAQKQDK